MKGNLAVIIVMIFGIFLLFSNAQAWEKRVDWLREINGIEVAHR
jgi:type IV secretory pathway VirB2 component (pilin)